MLEEQVSNLAGHFRYLALLLDAYDKRCPKIDRFVRQLQFSDISTCFWRNIVKTQHRSKLPFGLQILRGWGYILAQDRRSYSYFRSPDIGVRIIDVSDNNYTVVGHNKLCWYRASSIPRQQKFMCSYLYLYSLPRGPTR